VVLGSGCMDELSFNKWANRIVSLLSSEVVAKQETGGKAVDDKVIVGTVVGREFVSKID
jgi:hypothetical protein